MEEKEVEEKEEQEQEQHQPQQLQEEWEEGRAGRGGEEEEEELFRIDLGERFINAKVYKERPIESTAAIMNAPPRAHTSAPIHHRTCRYTYCAAQTSV